MSKAVQFKGIEDVLQAYDNIGVPNFYLVHDKQYLLRYQGGQMGEGYQLLEQVLQKLQNSGYAIYTLCLYDRDGELNSKTPYDQSFNFVLAERTGPGEYGSVVMSGVGGAGNTNLAVENALLKVEVKQLKEQLATKSSGGAIGAIEKLMEIPGMDQIISGVIGKLINKFLPENGGQNGYAEQPEPDGGQVRRVI